MMMGIAKLPEHRSSFSRFKISKLRITMCMIAILLTLGVIPLSEQNVISLAQGRLKGEVHDGYVSYRGVPYASVRTSDGRFKRAGLAPIWQGDREGREIFCSAVSSAEDCLLLDVHVPATGPGLWSVLMWISGGSGHYNPRNLVRKGIIVVMVYHRIGPQGFLCPSVEKIPGNAGVKDVILALRWVRDNIVAFKGNPAKVVMAGQSFGAAIAEGVMLSPMSIGLYQGVILQSGSVLAPWAFNYDAKERAMKLREMLADANDVSDMFFKAKIEELVDKSNKFDMPYFPFGMCIEKAMKHEERLLSEAPFDLLSSKKVAKVPMVIGYNNDEAYIFASILRESRAMKTISQRVTFLLPEELKFLNDREMKQVARQVEDVYFKQNKSLRTLLDYHRDAYFLNHIHRSARLHAAAFHPVYYYGFSYPGDFGVQEEPGVQKMGAAHSDELAYLFSGKDLDGDEATVQMHLVKLWTNFVKYLNPMYKESTRWDAFDPDNTRLLDIGTELKMIDYPHARSVGMWDDIYEKYYYSRNRVGG